MRSIKSKVLLLIVGIMAVTAVVFIFFTKQYQPQGYQLAAQLWTQFGDAARAARARTLHQTGRRPR